MARKLIEGVCKEVCDEMLPDGWMTIDKLPVWCLRDGKIETCRVFKLKIGT